MLKNNGEFANSWQRDTPNRSASSCVFEVCGAVRTSLSNGFFFQDFCRGDDADIIIRLHDLYALGRPPEDGDILGIEPDHGSFAVDHDDLIIRFRKFGANDASCLFELALVVSKKALTAPCLDLELVRCRSLPISLVRHDQYVALFRYEMHGHDAYPEGCPAAQ